MGEVLLPRGVSRRSVITSLMMAVAAVCSVVALTAFIPEGISPSMVTRQKAAMPMAITTSTREKPATGEQRAAGAALSPAIPERGNAPDSLPKEA